MCLILWAGSATNRYSTPLPVASSVGGAGSRNAAMMDARCSVAFYSGWVKRLYKLYIETIRESNMSARTYGGSGKIWWVGGTLRRRLGSCHNRWRFRGYEGRFEAIDADVIIIHGVVGIFENELFFLSTAGYILPFPRNVYALSFRLRTS